MVMVTTLVELNDVTAFFVCRTRPTTLIQHLDKAAALLKKFELFLRIVKTAHQRSGNMLQVNT